MEMPNYDGLIEKWKVDLITQRAKVHGFRPHEIPDVLQEAVLVVLEFKYDPNHAKGATERTALTQIVDNRLRKMKRSATRYSMHVERFGQDVSEFSTEEVDPTALDVETVIAGMDQRDQEICRGLVMGKSRNEIARQMGCGWATINRATQRLRRRFEEMGWAEDLA